MNSPARLTQPDSVAFAAYACQGYAVGVATTQRALAAHLIQRRGEVTHNDIDTLALQLAAQGLAVVLLYFCDWLCAAEHPLGPLGCKAE